jgi:hypothetical protein
MSPDRKSRIDPLQSTPPKQQGAPPSGGVRWPGWVIALGVLCVLGTPRPAYSADPPFNFDAFTRHKHFKLNTTWTTPFGPPWADILLKKENFLACKGASIALCYYSGPEESQTGGAATPCDLSHPGIANCTCYAIPPGNTYLVDINAILNLDVYRATVKKCGSDGGKCQPTGPDTAPVCDSINNGSLIPGADLISAFSLALEREIHIGNTSCDRDLYAGCMTAPCKAQLDPVTGLPVQDPFTGLDLVQCACPLWDGKYQVGQDIPPGSCTLGGSNVWSAAYAPLQELIPPPPPPPHHCWPDAPGDSGCPLLSAGNVPPPPPNVSCREVCGEYKKSNHKGIQVGFTCDATLCTAAADPVLVNDACTGLGKSSISEILALEIEVGYSCAASQVCGCEPNRKTNEEIFRLNQAQRDRGIDPQCDLNGTLCGAPR